MNHCMIYNLENNQQNGAAQGWVLQPFTIVEKPNPIFNMPPFVKVATL